MIIFTILNTLDGPMELTHVSKFWCQSLWSCEKTFTPFNLERTHTHTFSASFPSSRVPLAPSAAAPRIPCVSQHLHSRVEIVLSEVSLKKNHMHPDVLYQVKREKTGIESLRDRTFHNGPQRVHFWPYVLIHHQVESIAPCWEDVVLQRSWTVVGVDHMARLQKTWNR